MRFYDRYSQLILKGDKPFYSDVKHIHQGLACSTGIIYESIKGRKTKTTVTLPHGSNVWLVPSAPTTITSIPQVTNNKTSVRLGQVA